MGETTKQFASFTSNPRSALKDLEREERQEAISILAATAKGTGGCQVDFTTFGLLSMRTHILLIE